MALQIIICEIGFVSSGDYTIALTCDQDAEPEDDDDMSFISVIEAAVGGEGQVTTVAFTE